MNGLFSRTPSPIAIRPLLGAALLSVVEAILILPQRELPAVPRLGAIGVILLTAGAIIAGGRGDRTVADKREGDR